MSDVLRFVENGLVYKLPWAMEAVRVRAQANQDDMGFGMTIDDFELGLAVAAVETGTLNRSAALLIQAGFTLRRAAIKAVEQTLASFSSAQELHEWLSSDEVVALSERDDWPTPTSAAVWKSFRASYSPSKMRTWTKRIGKWSVRWRDKAAAPAAGAVVRFRYEDGTTFVLTPDYEIVGQLVPPLPAWTGLLLGQVADIQNSVILTYYGPRDIPVETSSRT
jgi:hypothetical protein